MNEIEEKRSFSLSWCSNQTRGASAELLSSNVALEGLEPEFFGRYSERLELCFVSSDEIIMSLK